MVPLIRSSSTRTAIGGRPCCTALVMSSLAMSTVALAARSSTDHSCRDAMMSCRAARRPSALGSTAWLSGMPTFIRASGCCLAENIDRLDTDSVRRKPADVYPGRSISTLLDIRHIEPDIKGQTGRELCSSPSRVVMGARLQRDVAVVASGVGGRGAVQRIGNDGAGALGGDDCVDDADLDRSAEPAGKLLVLLR